MRRGRRDRAGLQLPDHLFRVLVVNVLHSHHSTFRGMTGTDAQAILHRNAKYPEHVLGTLGSPFFKRAATTGVHRA